MSDRKIFKDMPDDGAYIDWLKNNKNGFVLNIDKGGTQSIYPKLHKASCSSFPIEKKRQKIGQQKLQTISKFAQTQSKNLKNGAWMNTGEN